jgi:hypothetical protein
MTLESIEVLDPTVSPQKENTLLADRPETLDGSIIGLLANGKRNSEELLKHVYDILKEKHNLGVMIPDNKGNASRPCPPDLLQNMADKCDVVITASGD